MPKILIITTGLTGILNASFELANRKIKEGNKVILSSPQNVKKVVEAQGFEFLPIPQVNYDPAPLLPDFTGFRKIRRWVYKISNAAKRKSTAIQNLGIKDFISEVKKVNPNQIIIDVELHEHIMTLVAGKYNVLLLSQWFSLWKRKGLPPIVSEIIPGVGFSGSSLGIWLAWKWIEINRWWMFSKKRILSVGTDRRSILLKYADSVGFSRSFIKKNYWPGPFVYDQLPVISMTDEALEFPHNKRPDLEYIGAMVYEKRVDIHCSEQLKREIDERIKEIKKEGRKLIYCSVSTFKAGDKSFIKKVISAVDMQPNWSMIIGLGGQLPSTFDLPSNVFSFEYVPQLQVLKEADLSINHGGIHTINECLHFEVPMLIYSGKKSDQNGCAARVHYHNRGITGDKDQDEVEDIRRKIGRVLYSN